MDMTQATDYVEKQKNDAKRFDAFYEFEWKKLHSYPILIIEGLDWRFWSSIVTTIAIVFSSALRTAQMFLQSEILSAKLWSNVGFNIDLSVPGMVFALFAFDGGLAVTSAIKTYNAGKVDDKVYGWQTGTLLSVTIMASLGQSIGVIPKINNETLLYFAVFLMLAMGIGTPVGSWLAGEIIGVLLLRYAASKKTATTEFNAKVDSYKTLAGEEWERRTKQEQTELTERIERDLKKAERAERKELREQMIAKGGGRPTSGKRAAIWSVLDTWRSESPNAIDLSFSDLCKLLAQKYPGNGHEGTDFTKSQISTERSAWINENDTIVEEYDDGKEN